MISILDGFLFRGRYDCGFVHEKIKKEQERRGRNSVFFKNFGVYFVICCMAGFICGIIAGIIYNNYFLCH